LFASIYVVSKEEIVGLGWETTIFEKTEEIIVLSMSVTADFNGSFKLK
jgi:hypothetical protein